MSYYRIETTKLHGAWWAKAYSNFSGNFLGGATGLTKEGADRAARESFHIWKARVQGKYKPIHFTQVWGDITHDEAMKRFTALIQEQFPTVDLNTLVVKVG